MPRIEKDGFKIAHKVNKQLALEQPPGGEGSAWDVVFLGDSITEGWRGTSYGIPVERKQDNLEVFQSLFRGGGTERSGDNSLSGLALGISGDRVCSLF
jgi:hypothetical protein